MGSVDLHDSHLLTCAVCSATVTHHHGGRFSIDRPFPDGWVKVFASGTVSSFCPAHTDDPRIWAAKLSSASYETAITEFATKFGQAQALRLRYLLEQQVFPAKFRGNVISSVARDIVARVLGVGPAIIGEVDPRIGGESTSHTNDDVNVEIHLPHYDLTWGGLKRAIENAGIRDDDRVEYFDFHSPCRLHIAREDESFSVSE